MSDLSGLSGRPVLWDRLVLPVRGVLRGTRGLLAHPAGMGLSAPRGTRVIRAIGDLLVSLVPWVLLGLPVALVLLALQALLARPVRRARRVIAEMPVLLERPAPAAFRARGALPEPLDPQDPRVLAALTAPLEPREMSALPALEVLRESQGYLEQMGLWDHLARQARRAPRATEETPDP